MGAMTSANPAQQTPIGAAEATDEAPKLVTKKYEQQRRAIIEAAAKVFNTKGVKGTTFSDVAASVGLIKTSVTYYFKRKEDLAAACFTETIGEYNRLIDTAASAATPEERVAGFLGNYFRLYGAIAAGQRPELLLFGDIRALTAPHVGPIFDAYTGMFRKVRRLLHGPAHFARDRRRLNARAHFLLSQILWTTAWFDRYEPDDYDRVASRLADIVVGGIAVGAQRWSEPPARDSSRDTSAREAFLRAATELINEQGYRGASVDKISAKLNLTKGSFYHHYDAKDDVVVACFERTFEIVRRTTSTARAGAGSFDRVNDIGAQLIRFQLGATGPLLRTSALAAVPEAIRGRMTARFRWLADKIADLVSDGIAEGVFRPVDPFVAAQAFTAMINSAEELRRWAPGVTPDTVLELYLRPLFEGVFAGPPEN